MAFRAVTCAIFSLEPWSGLCSCSSSCRCLGLLFFAASRGGQPPVPSDTALDVNLRGDVPEHAGSDWTELLQLGDRRPAIDLYTLTEAIRIRR